MTIQSCSHDRFISVFMAAVVLCAATRSLAQQDVTPVSEADVDAMVHVERAGDLRVLVWNVQRGANDFTNGAEKTLAVIRAIDPDVVLMQESYDINDDRPTLGRWMATELSWNAHQASSPHLCILTRLEIDATYFHADWHGLGARLIDEDGRAFIAYSIWIDYRAFVAYELRDRPDISDEALLRCETDESDRFSQAQAIIQHLRDESHLESSVPLLVGGDWNCPSHLDWTADTQRVYKYRRNLPLPVSIAMHEAGFFDAFRRVHPDPVQMPGITWTPLYRDNNATFDRIDRLYVKDPVEGRALAPVQATVLPLAWEDASIPHADRLFPSDHGAVVIDLRWTH